jgi:hypothetical protein
MNEIQDLRTDFLFIADEKKKNKFDTERTKLAFKNIKDRCVFQTYDFVEKWYKNQID